MAGGRVSVGWAAAAGLSVAALAVLAPGGLYLLGFLALVIALHEGAHYLAARRSGMGPVELFWGFGPEVFSFERNGCRYGVKALFLGGYVKLLGMTPGAELPDGFPESRTYRAARCRGRLATILAGPAANLATAVVAFTVAALLDGEPVGRALVQGWADLWFVLQGTVIAIWTWATNLGGYAASVLDRSGATEPPVRFLSPVAQARISQYAVSEGASTALRWLGVLSAAVGAVNLLPLPPLDGSHAVVAAIEGVLGRVRPARSARLDATRLLPLAYATVGVLVFLSLSALVLDLRDLG